MEKAAKRQWMQSVDGKIRVGPRYQAMIPPLCRADFIAEKVERTPVPEVKVQLMYCYSSDNPMEEQVDDASGNEQKEPKVQKVNTHCQYLVAEDFLISQ